MARPKNRPTTITEFEKQPKVIATHDEVHAFREEEKKKYNTELQRLANHKEVTMVELYTDYNIEPAALEDDNKYEQQITLLNDTIVAGDESAILRLQEVQAAFKLYKQKINQFLKARQNHLKNYEAVIARIDVIDRRRLDKIALRHEKQERKKRATVEYVEQLELKVNKVMALRRELKLNIKYERKIAWLTAKVEEHEQELFKIKALLQTKGIDQ